jgi:hypothetical protein
MQARFGTSYISVYFQLNEDGTINEDSITTTYPGELAMDRESTRPFYVTSTGVMPVPEAPELDREELVILQTDTDGGNGN